MTEITISRTCAIIDRCEQFTSGRVGARIKFSFSSEWAGLSKTAVFTNGDTTIDVLNVADEITIPHEVLALSGKKLKVGVYGFTVDDHGNIEIAIPTVYADLGKVVKGADPSGDESTEPSLPIWAQTQALIGNLSQIETETKDSLVAAINEVKQTTDTKQDKLIAGENITIAADGKTISATGGGGSTVELDTTLTQSGKAADAKAVGDALAGKQNTISDLESIRTGAAKGATALQSVPSTYRTANEQDTIDDGKVDKVTGKGLSSNDYTDAAKAKVDALAPVATSGSYNDLTNKPTIPAAYDDTEVRQRIGAIEAKESTWDAKSDFSGSYNDLTDKPVIPDAVTEGTVSSWGFTKNTGTYSKPTGGIPKADLANDVQASLGKADTALQEHQSLAAYRTAAAQNIIDVGKQDRLIAGDNITIAADGKTISATGGAEALIVTITDNNGTLSADKSYIEIRDAILAGTPVLVVYDGTALPLIALTADALYFGTFQCDSGDASSGAVVAAIMIEITSNGEVNDFSAQVDIPKTLPSPNSITFTGAVTGSYDGSAPLSVNIPTAPTKTSQLTNDAGYLTLSTLPKYEGVVE